MSTAITPSVDGAVIDPMFAELTPPYSTIVADPPWSYAEGWPGASTSAKSNMNQGATPHGSLLRRKPMAYSSMSVDEIAAMPVTEIAATDAHLYLWTTNRYLRDAYGVCEAWGFRFSQVLVWCKTPMGIGPGGAFSITTEFVLHARRGSLKPRQRIDSTWWEWPRRGGHSAKPDAFLDIVEQVSPGPHVELFCRRPRLGWDSWGYGYEIGESA